MKFFEKNPIIMLAIGVLGVSMSAILVRLADAPSAIIATLRLSWTVLLLTPMVFLKKANRNELFHVERKKLLLCMMSGVCLAFHFLSWFESLKHTSVASSLAFGCTEVIWVSIGFSLFMKGKLTNKEILCIAGTMVGSILIALADSTAGGRHLYGDMLALFSAVAVAAYTLFGREARKTMTTTVYTYIVYITCAAVLIIITLTQGYSAAEFDVKVFFVCLLLAVCGCGEKKEKDPTREEIIKISITPMPSPTPAPAERAPEAVVTEGNLTMVNEFLAEKLESEPQGNAESEGAVESEE